MANIQPRWVIHTLLAFLFLSAIILSFKQRLQSDRSDNLTYCVHAVRLIRVTCCNHMYTYCVVVRSWTTWPLLCTSCLTSARGGLSASSTQVRRNYDTVLLLNSSVNMECCHFAAAYSGLPAFLVESGGVNSGQFAQHVFVLVLCMLYMGEGGGGMEGCHSVVSAPSSDVTCRAHDCTVHCGIIG